MRALAAMGFLVALFVATVGNAQEGCRASQRSCSQMNADCEQKCQGGNNPSACVARICSNAFTGCKANGVWKGAAATACWKTGNRS